MIIILCLCKAQKLPTPYKNVRMKMTHRKILHYKLSSLHTAGSRAKKIKTLDFSFQVRPKWIISLRKRKENFRSFTQQLTKKGAKLKYYITSRKFASLPWQTSYQLKHLTPFLKGNCCLITRIRIPKVEMMHTSKIQNKPVILGSVLSPSLIIRIHQPWTMKTYFATQIMMMNYPIT